MLKEIEEQFKKWLEEDNKSSHTVKSYINALHKLAKWYEETEGTPFDPSAVTTMHLHEFRSYLDNIEQSSPATINANLAAIKVFYNFALEKGKVSYDPTRKIKIKKSMHNTSPRWMTKFEIAKFYQAIEEEKNEKRRARDMAICRLMSGAGLRESEVANLNIGDISLEHRMEDVTVRKGKGDKLRYVPLNKDVIEALEEWLKHRNVTDPREPLFISQKKNNRITGRSIYNIVSKYAKKAGLEDISPHNLRHTFCKTLIDQGIGIERVAYLAGHENIETTRIYTLPSEQDLRKAVDSISEIR